ncbi:hypothetical protein BHE74_00029359, partial [Ensete ventricosum]
ARASEYPISITNHTKDFDGFSLIFGTEAVLSPEVVYPTFWVETYQEPSSSDRLRENLDLLEERRATMHMQILGYKKAVANLYNRIECPPQIKVGDMVLRKVEVSDPTRFRGKLAPNWEGPYQIKSAAREGTYTLVMM